MRVRTPPFLIEHLRKAGPVTRALEPARLIFETFQRDMHARASARRPSRSHASDALLGGTVRIAETEIPVISRSQVQVNRSTGGKDFSARWKVPSRPRRALGSGTASSNMRTCLREGARDRGCRPYYPREEPPSPIRTTRARHAPGSVNPAGSRTPDPLREA